MGVWNSVKPKFGLHSLFRSFCSHRSKCAILKILIVIAEIYFSLLAEDTCEICWDIDTTGRTQQMQNTNSSFPQAFQRCEKVNFQVLSKCKVKISLPPWGSEEQGSSRSRFYRLSLDQRALQIIISLSCSLQKQLVTRIDSKLGQHPFISLKRCNSILCHFNRKILKQQQVL